MDSPKDPDTTHSLRQQQEDLKARLQFVLLLVLFFPTVLQALYQTGGTGQDASKVILQWGMVVMVFTLFYLFLEAVKDKLSSKMMKILDWILLADIVCFIPVLFVFAEGTQVSWIPVLHAIPFGIGTIGILLIPLALFLLISGFWAYGAIMAMISDVKEILKIKKKRSTKDRISTSLANLRSLKEEHLKMGRGILEAKEGAMYPMDLLTVALLNRSLCLLSAFCDLIEKRNFIAAAPLLRLQLDTLLRGHAAWLVKDPHQFATDVLAGKSIRKMKDRTGKDMTDHHLVDTIAKEHPQLRSVYERTSGYVHLSEAHFFNAIRAGDGKGKANIKISETDSFIPEEAYIEAMQAYLYITGTLFRYLEGWRLSKDGKATADT